MLEDICADSALNGEYTQLLNRILNGVWHVFQGRYKVFHDEKEDCLLELCRYVVLNQVRAGVLFAWSENIKHSLLVTKTQLARSDHKQCQIIVGMINDYFFCSFQEI